MYILVPPRLTPLKAMNFSSYVGNFFSDSKFIYDFGQMQHCHPFGLLVVASAIRNNIKRFPEAEHEVVNCSSTQGCQFASTFGFFQSIGFDIGQAKNEDDSGYRYVPIKPITSDYLHSLYTDTTLLNEKVNRQAKILSDTLVGNQSRNVREAVQYCFREIMRNVFEHAHTYELWVCGQYWPSRDEAEIAILDEGIGILRSLQSNPKIHAETCAEAIKLALQPGLSRTIGMKKDPYDKWQNSGYGLYVASTLCAINGGYFIISSGDSALYVGGTEQKEYYSRQVGTAICVNIRTNSRKLLNFDSTLKSIVDEGEKAAQENGEKRILTASKVTSIASMVKHIETDYDQRSAQSENLIPFNTVVSFFAQEINAKSELLGYFEYNNVKYNGVLINVTRRNREFYLRNQAPIIVVVRKLRSDSYTLLEKNKYDKQVKNADK